MYIRVANVRKEYLTQQHTKRCAHNGMGVFTVPSANPFGDIMTLPSFHLGTSCPSHHPIWGHHVPPIIPFGDIMSLPSSHLGTSCLRRASGAGIEQVFANASHNSAAKIHHPCWWPAHVGGCSYRTVSRDVSFRAPKTATPQTPLCLGADVTSGREPKEQTWGRKHWV